MGVDISKLLAASLAATADEMKDNLAAATDAATREFEADVRRSMLVGYREMKAAGLAGNTGRNTMEEFEKVSLVCANGPELRFEGRVLAEVTTQRANGSKTRWTELRLWQTRAGNFIAESVGCSDADNQRDLCDALVVEVLTEFAVKDEGGVAVGVERKGKMPLTDDQKLDIMRFFKWSGPARELASKMDWTFVREIA